jgi:hypothetical protein
MKRVRHVVTMFGLADDDHYVLDPSGDHLLVEPHEVEMVEAAVEHFKACPGVHGETSLELARAVAEMMLRVIQYDRSPSLNRSLALDLTGIGYKEAVARLAVALETWRARER